MYITAALEEARAESHAGAAREEPGMIDSYQGLQRTTPRIEHSSVKESVGVCGVWDPGGTYLPSYRNG